jgi:hypothetical protein
VCGTGITCPVDLFALEPVQCASLDGYRWNLLLGVWRWLLFNKKIIFIYRCFFCLFFLCLGFYCWVGPHREVTYLVSKENPRLFCNGNQMNGAGFARTVTELQSARINSLFLSEESLLKLSVSHASRATYAAHSYHLPKINLYHHVAYVEPLEGWSGVSIFLCSWKPLVEKNLLRYPFVERVVWRQ